MPLSYIQNRFKVAMLPSLILGVATNIYIFIVLFVVGANDAFFSPIIGAIVFLLCFLFLRKDKISAKTSFLIAAYTVAVEIWVHTYFLGWNTGFTYFIFLLPVVFLLNASWRLWMIIFFNGTIALITAGIWIQFYKVDPVYLISNEAVQYISLLNGAGTGVIILIIMIFFSRSLNRRDQDLIEANYELEERNEEISKQHKSLQILIKEIHHRVKNNLQIISSLMSLQSRSVADREISEILNESRQRIDSIAMIHQKLSRDDQANRVDFKAYLEDLTLFQKNINSNLKCLIESPSVTLNLDVAVPLGIIISELIINANKHAFDKTDEPELFVFLEKIESGFSLVVSDNGIGYPIGFGRTKAESLGMEIINALVDQIGAKVEFSNHNGAQCKIQFEDIEEPRRLKI